MMITFLNCYTFVTRLTPINRNELRSFELQNSRLLYCIQVAEKI